jgi:alanyl-tRNA synthetase
MTVEEAKNMGAIAEFGEKYADKVRVIDLKYTLDLCGGTHVKNISDIDRFAIKSVASIGSGIYRIEAVVNKAVDNLEKSLVGLNQDIDNLLIKAKKILEEASKADIMVEFNYTPSKSNLGSYQDVINKRIDLANAQMAVKELEKEFKRLKQEKVKNEIIDLSEFIFEDKLIAKLTNVSSEVLKQVADDEIAKDGINFIFLASIVNEKVVFVAKSLDKSLNAGQLVKTAAQICGGNGGGRPDFAQAGGKDVNKVDLALDKIKEIIL